MAEIRQVLIPDIGDFRDVPVIEVLVKPGDPVSMEDPLVVLESDKATIEVPSPFSGTIARLSVKVGDTVSEGTVILEIAASATGADTPPVAPAAPVTAAAVPAAPVVPAPVAAGTTPSPPFSVNTGASIVAPTKAHAGPSVRRFARELGVNLDQVKGSGPKQRILKKDVQSYVKAALSGLGKNSPAGLDLLPWPQVNFARFGPVKSVPLSRIKKISGANLHRNWVMIPHVTQFDEADITDLETLRKRHNANLKKDEPKITLLSFLISAIASALKTFPEFNASLENQGNGQDELNLIIKHYYHIGFAADTPNGLVVPVIRDADQKNITSIATELGTLSGLAREGKLKPADMQGSGFTISSLGGVGGTAFTPIINAPEVAILGVSRASIKPVYAEGNFVPRLILPLSLSYDHRVIDGASAARFTTHLSSLLAGMHQTVSL
jgi:pyruvate dehydrogenase E2 component (dihydrolipoamide acetyltransferase)